MVDRHGDFIIFPYRDHHVIVNTKGSYENHTHIKKRDTCKMLIDLVCRKRVPKSMYLRSSAKRISRDEKYIENINIKNEKDKNKQKYHNIQRGIRR